MSAPGGDGPGGEGTPDEATASGNGTLDETATAAADAAGATFEGYERPDGSVGARNRALVLPSVICSGVVAERIARRVEGAVGAAHDHGCAQLGADNEQTRRTMLGVAANPNVAGALVVGLGCEELQSDEVAAGIADRSVPVEEVAIQDVGGTDRAVEAGVAAARELVADARADRARADLSAVNVGVVSGDLRAGTVAEADPLVGGLVDALVDTGGRVVAAGVERLAAHPDAAPDLAADAATERDLERLLDRHRDRPARERRVRRAAGRRSLDAATRAWGDRPVRDVLDYGEVADHDEGLAVVDAPSGFAEAATGLAAAGAEVIVHLTGEGVPTGHPVAPVLKVTGDRETYEALSEDVDVDATATSVDELLDALRSVLDGAPTAAERHGLREFAITRVGPSM